MERTSSRRVSAQPHLIGSLALRSCQGRNALPFSFSQPWLEHRWRRPLGRAWNGHELIAALPLSHPAGTSLWYVAPLVSIFFTLFFTISVSFLCSASSSSTHTCVMKHNTTIVARRRRSYSFRRLPRSPAFKLILLLFVLWDSINCISLHLLQTTALDSSPPPRNTKRIYIAAQHYNSARLLRENWNEALYNLVKELGVESVFVSIYESGSYDDTQQALRELDANLDVLQVKRKVVLSELTHKEEIEAQPADHGWINTPAGVRALRRIPFLSSIRNKVFQPLEQLSTEGEHFDTILFLNDVAFKPEDALRLLTTNDGDYAAACSLDFSKPPYFYDTFALRDSDGHEAIMQTWPYFRSYASRQAAERFQPVPVSSCWNGMGENQSASQTIATLIPISCNASRALPWKQRHPLSRHKRFARQTSSRRIGVLSYTCR